MNLRTRKVYINFQFINISTTTLSFSMEVLNKRIFTNKNCLIKNVQQI